MKYIITLFACLSTTALGLAQEASVKQLQEASKNLLKQGDLDNAIAVLNKAVQQEPASLELRKDLSFAHYVKRDFAKAIEVGKPLAERPDADQQTFQVLGMSYKAIAEYKECAKMYRTALRKFPNSGMLYNEYGELLAMDKELEEAIIQWEKGITADPTHSGNYYNAALYHARKNNWVRVLIYGEQFLNLESFSTRTLDAKKAVLAGWRNLLVSGAIVQHMSLPGVTSFEKAILETLAKAAPLAKEGLNGTNITPVRSLFLQEWAREKQQQYPFRLFDQQQLLVREGVFEAYNQWLFAAAANSEAYRSWQELNPEKEAAFKLFQQTRLFVVPPGQHYLSN